MADKSHKEVQTPLTPRNMRALRRNAVRGYLGSNGRIYSHPPEPKYISTRVYRHLRDKNTPRGKYLSKAVENVAINKNTVRGRRRRRSGKNRHTRRN